MMLRRHHETRDRKATVTTSGDVQGGEPEAPAETEPTVEQPAEGDAPEASPEDAPTEPEPEPEPTLADAVDAAEKAKTAARKPKAGA